MAVRSLLQYPHLDSLREENSNLKKNIVFLLVIDCLFGHSYLTIVPFYYVLILRSGGSKTMDIGFSVGDANISKKKN